MGVKSCSRKECPRIMCDTYIEAVGYICDDCQNEFKSFFGDTLTTTHQIRDELVKFMETEPKGENKETTINEFFSENTLKF